MTTNQNRVLGGVPDGGQFARTARAEPQVHLGGPGSETTVTVTGTPGPATQTWVHALEAVPGGAQVELDVRRDDEQAFTATARVHDVEYQLRHRDTGSYWVTVEGGAISASAAEPRGTMTQTLGKSLGHVRTQMLARETMASVERMTREEHSSELVKTYPVALHRDHSHVTEIGFALPGDHLKVRVYDQKDPDTPGQLFSYSPVTDGYNALTDRQRRNRLNKALDAIGPDREYGEAFVRRYLALAGHEQDRRIETDPLLSALQSADAS